VTPAVLHLVDNMGAALDRSRILNFCYILLAVELAGFLFVVAGTHGLIVPLPRPASTDFVSFYAAGALADAGEPQRAYDQAAHHAAEERATAAGVDHRYFYYPPVFLLVCAAFARLPYMTAFIGFEAVTLVLFLMAARAILPERSWRAIVPVLAFPAVFWTIGLGQNSFLTSALFGTGTLWIDRRPVLAGLCFGALCYKPHFGLLVAVALLAGAHWRALGAAIVSAAALCALSLMIFGWETWQSFFAAAAGSPATYESGRIAFGGLVSPFGAVLLLGGTPSAAYAMQAAATLAAGLMVAVVWRRGLPLPVRAATLAAATLIAIPIVLIYDLMLAAIAVAWLIRDKGGLASWEKLVVAGMFVLALGPRGLAEASHVPIAPLVALAVVALTLAHAFRAAAPRYA
jgi:alpha-1,2-mannosyltransferase